MKLEICAVGKVLKANIDIKGITIIAGENDVGKSTVGKTLFAIFQTYYDLKNKLFKEKYNSIKDLLETEVFYNSIRDGEDVSWYFDREGFDKSIQRIIGLFENSRDREELKKDAFLVKVYGADIESKVDDIVQRLEIDNKELLQNILTRTFQGEFNQQINYLFDNVVGVVNLEIKEKHLSLRISDNEVSVSESLFDLITEITYIDNPLIIDDMDNRFSFSSDMIQHHSDYLRKQFLRKGNQNTIERVLVDKRLESINKIFSNIYDWGVVSEDASSGNETKVDAKNLSSGLKSFYILKRLLENGTIRNRSTIILDEPEVHLHPEWQLVYAKLLIILQKELDLHILINTHSPYFLNAIEVFSEKYKITDKCTYYLAENEDNRSKIMDVTGDTEKIYRKLSSALQTLENIRGSIDD